jgi:hypothetical protein
LRTKTVLIGVIVVFASLLSPASGNHDIVSDPNDTSGRADIRKIRMVNDRPRKWVFRTWRNWQINDFFERGWFVLYLDTFGGGRFDYFVFVRATRRDLAGAVWRDFKKKDDRKVAGAGTKKIGKAHMRVSVPFRKMRIGGARLKFRWFGRSIWSGPHCRQLCLDRAPNRKVISELFIPNP